MVTCNIWFVIEVWCMCYVVVVGVQRSLQKSYLSSIIKEVPVWTSARPYSINHCKDMSLPTYTLAFVNVSPLFICSVPSLYTVPLHIHHITNSYTQSYNATYILCWLLHCTAHVTIALLLISCLTSQVRKGLVCVWVK